MIGVIEQLKKLEETAKKDIEITTELMEAARIFAVQRGMNVPRDRQDALRLAGLAEAELRGIAGGKEG